MATETVVLFSRPVDPADGQDYDALRISVTIDPDAQRFYISATDISRPMGPSDFFEAELDPEEVYFFFKQVDLLRRMLMSELMGLGRLY